MKDYTNQTIDDKYYIASLLGKGGMGAVYLGKHKVIGKKVAIKFLHTRYIDNQEMVKRFFREAQAAAKISHGNIINVLDVGISSEGEPYLVMEYLEGESLSHLLEREGKLDLAAACGLMEPVLTALSAAHAQGIVHRDLKPENIFLVLQPVGASVVKIIDFGVSKFIEQSEGTKMTQTGMVLGTPAYMSPEQAMGHVNSIDARTDVYAVGVILFEMLTGELPIEGKNNQEMMVKVATTQPRRPSEVSGEFPVDAEPVVMKALSKAPEFRYQSASEMLDALRLLSAFSKRNSRITQLAATIADVTFAGGDLGSAVTTVDTPDGAPSAMAAVGREVTPEARTSSTDHRPSSIKKTRHLVGLAVLVLAAVSSLVGVAMWRNNTSEMASAPVVVSSEPLRPAESNHSAAPALALGTSVTIQVVGAPAGSQLLFDGRAQKDNPFATPKTHGVKQLRVSAEGYKTTAISVVPNMDQTLTVSLEPSKKVMITPETKKIWKRGPRDVDAGSRNTMFTDDYN